jgi:hypothetical protein
MTRYFALPILATVLAHVGVRVIGAPAPVEPAPAVVIALPAQEPEAPSSPIVTPQGLWEPAPPAPPPRPPQPQPAPKPEPVIIVLEPLPAPAPQVEVVNNPVIAPQTTVIHAPVINFYPVVEVVVPPPAQEVVEVPVAVAVGVPLCAAHRRPGCCLPKASVVQQDPFFKKIPFLPPTPRRARFDP